jgi:hypothetical protein
MEWWLVKHRDDFNVSREMPHAFWKFETAVVTR